MQMLKDREAKIRKEMGGRERRNGRQYGVNNKKRGKGRVWAEGGEKGNMCQ